MGNLFNRFGLNQSKKDISYYPELHQKKNYNNSLSYNIAIATSAVFYDVPSNSEAINWKVI